MEIDVLKTFILVLHITAAALWMGAPLGVMKNVERSLASSKDALGLAIKDFNLRGQLAAIGGMGVLITGVFMMFYYLGGFKTAPWPFHAALGLTLLAIVNSFAFGKGIKYLQAAHDDYGNADTRAAADRAVGQMKPFAHISNLLWLGSLTMMIIAKFVPRA